MNWKFSHPRGEYLVGALLQASDNEEFKIVDNLTPPQEPSRFSTRGSFEREPEVVWRNLQQVGVDDDKVICIHNLTLHDNGHTTKNGEPCLPNGYIPKYIHKIFTEFNYSSPSGKVKSIESAFLIDHPNSGVHGHFLVECLPKVFVVQQLQAIGMSVPLVLWGADAKRRAKFVEAICPKIDVVCLPDCFNYKVSRAYLPSTTTLLTQYRKASFREACASIAQISPSSYGKILYVKRPSTNSFRKLTNIKEIEEMLQARGVELMQPEQLSPDEQISAFYSASCVIGEYGSGLHNAIFSKKGTSIICFNLINGIQQAISITCGHRLHAIFPTSGHAVRWESAKKMAPQNFSIHLSDLEEALDDAGIE